MGGVDAGPSAVLVRLFGLLWPLTLAEPDAWSTSVFIYEFDTSAFKCTPYYFECGTTRLTNFSLQLVHRYDPHARFFSQLLLAPSKKTTCGSTLLWSDHKRQNAKPN